MKRASVILLLQVVRNQQDKGCLHGFHLYIKTVCSVEILRNRLDFVTFQLTRQTLFHTEHRGKVNPNDHNSKFVVF